MSSSLKANMSVRKHLVNDPTHCVDESLLGLVTLNSGLQLLEGHRVIVRADLDVIKQAQKVTIVTGGGSGHEPCFAGYVGRGMLSAAVCGSVFASPPPDAILAALQAIGDGNPAGTLLVVMNYTGDRLNFGLAAERAKAQGLRVESILVAEDCALASHDKTAGRRGLCGSVLINKLAGALAEEGKPLEDIVRICNSAMQNMGTIGLSLSPCSIPGQTASFHLDDDQIELGLGIHGEAGVKKMQMMHVKQAVDVMLCHMTNPSSSTHVKIMPGASVALMVNNLGGTPQLEMSIVALEAIHWLEKHKLNIKRTFSGTFMTALEMMGVSLTILYVDNEICQALDAETDAIGWVKPFSRPDNPPRTRPFTALPAHSDQQADTKGLACLSHAESLILHKAVTYASEALGNSVDQLNALDRHGGDGDCGSTLKRGADAISEALGPPDNPGLPVLCPHHLLLSLSKIAETSMGGSSGALYSLLLTAGAGPLATDLSPGQWCQALHAGIKAVMRYGGAAPGDRTMLDALDAAHKSLETNLTQLTYLEAFSAAVQAAEEAACQTVNLPARAGRASYVSSEVLTQPDPGAHAVAVWMRAAYEACKLMS